MAKQTGALQLEGQMGNMTFYKTQRGHLMRLKGGIAKGRIHTDIAFERTRENMAEFSRATMAGRVLRDILKPLTQRSADIDMVSRLSKEMVKVLQSDTVSERGQRTISAGDLELLEGFEFNKNSHLATSLCVPFIPTINRETGELNVHIDPFIPANIIQYGEGATHFKIVVAGMEVDFETELSTTALNASAPIPLSNVQTDILDLVAKVTANSALPLFLVVGIQFFQGVNGYMYPLRNISFNSLAIAKVSGAII